MSEPQSAGAGVPRAVDDEERIAAVQRSGLLDTPAEEAFDFLVEIAARVCGTAQARLALVDRDRVWIKAAFGMETGSSPRDACPEVLAVVSEGSLSIPDLAADPRTADWSGIQQTSPQRMYAGVCLTTDDGLRVGALSVFDVHSGTLDADRLRLLSGLARQAMILIESHTQRLAIEQARADGERLATVDEATGLLNRQALLERLDIEVERARRFGAPLSLAVLDIDRFETIDDPAGHDMRDTVLHNVGAAVRDELRQVDIAGRVGAGAFCIVLPGTPLPGGLTLADALRQEIESIAHVRGERSTTTTASLGVVALDEAHGEDAIALLQAADDALARARRAGGNRVEHAAGSSVD
ncbi:MAG: diguanylate cyclase [Proteobacteria bacterium]|nr:diguanylate cyclase [Pseudomonadota bacterium]